MALYQGTRFATWTHWFVPILFLLATVGDAALVPFTNCLDAGYLRTEPRLLQLVPLNVTAVFDTTNPSHNLNVTFYGNVSGQSTEGTYPAPNDPSWNNPEDPFGKILDVAIGASLRTTLFKSMRVLSYNPYLPGPSAFCDEVIHGQCPLAPSFNTSPTALAQLPAWSVADNMGAAFAFTEIIVTSRVQSGLPDGPFYACINAFVTPDIGESWRALLRYVPVGILAAVAIATISAAIFSPWGTWDIFRWTSNFGRDEDVLRLVTPGFGDCLQYLQFVVLTGSLSLNYPGFYQPIVSRVGWSSLIFNESFVSHGDGTSPVVDGIYSYRSPTDSGLDRMTQLIGMTAPDDAWAGMMVWLVVLVAGVAVLTQIGFALRWVYRIVMKIPAEDLLSKNWYFTVGNAIRLTIGYFLLPIISLSMYQFAIAGQSPIYTVVLAAVVLVGIVAFSVRLVFLFARTRPRSFLFDDLQTVLATGPLFNTFRDDAATFALIPILVNFLRGIAIGAVQVSGVAQIVLLAISEIVFVLSINAFRPYPAATSMNLYHTCFSIIRLITVLLSVAFAPSLHVGGGNRGWIAYVILLIHACVLVFGFFFNAIQTLVEVIARLAGAGGSGGTEAARGALVKVFGVRQLSKRMPRADNASHHSLGSNAGMLNTMDEHKDSHISRSRSRSVSLSSTMLLEKNMRSPRRESQLYAGTSDGQITPDAASTFSGRPIAQAGSGGIVGLSRQVELKDPYYRPPRRNTMDLLQNERPLNLGGNNSTHGGVPGEFVDDRGEGTSTPHKVEDFEEPMNELTKTKTDYAVREVDFYYGFRGPALSSGTRKLKTGPADPTGPVSNATGWFKGLLGGRTKEKTKGFEVVRSARAPPPGLRSPPDNGSEPDPTAAELYTDEPQIGTAISGKAPQTGLPDQSRDIEVSSDKAHDELVADSSVPADPPLLPLIDTVGGIELPEQSGSEHSRMPRTKRPPPNINIPEVPVLPRRSSRRGSSVDSTKAPPNRRSIHSPSTLPVNGQQNESRPGSSRAPLTGTQSGNVIVIRNANTDSAVDGQENRTPDAGPSIPSAGLLHSASASLAYGAEIGRPESVGRVREHRASDAITYRPESNTVEGKSAEIHDSEADTRQPWAGQGTNNTSGAINPYGQPGQRASRFRD